MGFVWPGILENKPIARSSGDDEPAELVKRVEAVLRQEQANWGQLTAQIEIPTIRSVTVMPESVSVDAVTERVAGGDPLCFVLMPFGRKSDGAGGSIDFDAIYAQMIAPAIRAAGLEPIRADEEVGGGIIHKPMFERLILCEYAVADLTLANANVFYELGVRQAVRPYSTVLVFAAGTRLPFDVALDRGLQYSLTRPASPTMSKPTARSSPHAWRRHVMLRR